MESESPGYRDIVERFRTKILSGEIPPESRLPAVRALARESSVALTTAQRAYAELKRLGLIHTQPGRGTRVAATLRRDAGTAMLSQLPACGPIMSFERVSEGMGLRSLATGVPDPDLFRFEDFIAEFDRLRQGSGWNWYYAPACGHPALRSRIVSLLASRGIAAAEGEVLVTNGSTDGLSIVLGELAPPGGSVILEQPSFLGANEMLDALRLSASPVSTGPNGIDLDQFESAAQQNEGAVAVLFPTFHPATGRSVARRDAVIDIARRHGVVLVEVDRYRAIAFEAPPKPLAALDPDVTYVDSFSYCLAPGLRLGYVRAAKPMADRLVQRGLATGLSCSTPMQMALASFLSSGGLAAHLQRVVPQYRRRRDALVRSLHLRMPSGASWTEPAGGFASWVTLPPGRYEDLYDAALEKGVAFTPSDLMLLEPDARKLRLAFGCQEPSAIESAIDILARLVKERVDRV